MKKLLLLYLLTLTTTLAFSQADKVIESYEIQFHPAFDSDLTVRLKIRKNRTAYLELSQDSKIRVYKTIYENDCKDKDCRYYLVKDSISKNEGIQMPYFVFDMKLDNELKNKYLNIFERINEFGGHKDKSFISGTDGITIYFTHNEKGIVKEYVFRTPSSETDLGKSILELLAMLESVPYGVVHKTVRDITNYFGHKDWYIKTLKDDTIYIKVLKQPYPCSESVKKQGVSFP